jgi:hypothetical protein
MKYMTLLAVLLCGYSYVTAWAQSSDDWDWVNKHFPTVLNQLLPIEASSGTSVGFRSYQDLYADIPEYSFLFNRDHKTNQVEVVVRMADGESLYKQMLSLHRDSPDTSVAAIRRKLRVKEWRITQQRCPKASTWFDSYWRIQFVNPSPDLLILHPMFYEFFAQTTAGTMSVTLIERNNPLVVWACNTREALQTCTQPDKDKSRQGQ